jgi:arylsulfatase A-like enzyme
MPRLLLISCLTALLTATSAHAGHPNILFLLSDDQRFDTIHALGNDDIRTPNLDRLVRDGFTFTHAFCMGSNQPAVCVASRAMMMTGRGLFHTAATIPKEQTMLPETLRAAGYTTFHTGKWHNDRPSLARSFTGGESIFFGGMTDQFKVPVQDFDPAGKYEPKRNKIGTKFSSVLFADAAEKFLRGHKGEQPFFLYVAFTSPHDPRTPPADFASLYDPAKLPLPKSFMPVHPFNNGELTIRDEKLAPWPRTPEVVRQHTADYYGMITSLDAEVGRILKALEESGKAKDTIVVFASDHGLAVGRHGLFGKQNLYDHSMRPPLIFAGPGVPHGKSDALCYLYDIYPTLCDLADVRIPATVEGKSLVPILRDKTPRVRDAVMLAYRDVQRAARTEEWKLIRYPQINKSQLFDVKDDPDELRDLAADPRQAAKLAEMTGLLREMQKQAGDKLPLSTDKPAPLKLELPPKN